MHKVLVLIIKSEPSSTEKNIIELKKVFSDPYFTVDIIYIHKPSLLKKTKKMSIRDLIIMNQIQTSLKYSASLYPNIPVICILDTSVTSETSETMVNKIKSISDSDVCYLCKWYDDCQNMKAVPNFKNVYYNNNPKDFQAIFFSTKLRNKIISDETLSNKSLSLIMENMIKNKEITSLCFSPNIVDYDISLAKNDEDYYKLNECSVKTQKNPNETVAYIWFLLILCLIILVSWFIIKLDPEEDKQIL